MLLQLRVPKVQGEKMQPSRFVVSRTIVVLPQAQAGEFRRAMYFLCSLALMGTEDQLLQAKTKGEIWSRLGWWGRLELRVSSLPLEPRVSLVLDTCTWTENLRVSVLAFSSRHMVTSTFFGFFAHNLIRHSVTLGDSASKALDKRFYVPPLLHRSCKRIRTLLNWQRLS